jgi:hypothetical protein
MIFSRLKTAIREQNWVAVAIEIIVVVLGVVIGFQITDWGARRADLAAEKSYLTQISADLLDTKRLQEAFDRELSGSENAAHLLFDSFRKIDPLSDDSVLILMSDVWELVAIPPTVGNITALINTGDLKLIRNDSLRLRIPAVLDGLNMVNDWQLSTQRDLNIAFIDLGKIVDMANADLVKTTAGGIDKEPSPAVNTSNREYSTAPPFPFSAAQFRSSSEAYQIVFRIHYAKIQAKMLRKNIVAMTGPLYRQIEAELSR